ncbi:MAG: NUDIX domain-containing protein [Bacilli bacterium]|nr:NUDIX domain-containing protein [Bacilli bacterium]
MEIKKKRIGVYGVIIQNEKIALVRKAGGGYKGKLDLPGGGMEHKEMPIETLKRELMEEAEVEVTNCDLLDVTATNVRWLMPDGVYEDLHHIGILYTVTITGSKVKTDADGLDSEGCNWYNISELNKNELSPFTIYALEKLEYNIK